MSVLYEPAVYTQEQRSDIQDWFSGEKRRIDHKFESPLIKN